jgi:hypothetical protein
MKTLASILLVIGLLAGCQRQPSTPPAASPSAPPGATAAAAPGGTVETTGGGKVGEYPHQAEAERSSAYAREHPWGENTGTARVSGVLSWDEDGPVAPAFRPALVLRGVPGTPSQDRFYRTRTNEQGHFIFDRIKGGEYQLRDQTGREVHWRLRVDVAEGQDLSVDLSPANTVKVRDDFPPEKPPEKG